MTAAAATADLPLQPAPDTVRPRADSGVYTLPAFIAVVLKVIARAKELAATLHQAAAHPGFAEAARGFGTSDPAIIMICLRRGLMRANALYAMLLRRQARGLHVPMARPPTPALPRPPRGQDRPAASAPARWWKDCDLAYLPTQAEIDDELRRRDRGQILADICLDLSIHSRNADPLWYELFQPIVFCGGNLCDLMLRFDERFGELPEVLPHKEARRAKRAAAAAPGEAASQAPDATDGQGPDATDGEGPDARPPAAVVATKQPAGCPAPQPRSAAPSPPIAKPVTKRLFRDKLLSAASTLQWPEPPAVAPESAATGPP